MKPPLKLSVFVSAHCPAGRDPVQLLDDVTRRVEFADRNGFESVVLGHHYLSSEQFLQPMTLAAYLAARTERIRIGFGVYLLPLGNPLAIAEELATLDVLSGGRISAGFGAGYRKREFAAAGVPFDERFRRLEEYVGVVQRLWSGETVDHAGSFGELDGAAIELRPLQPGGPPIWLGAFGEIGIRRAARLGTIWLGAPEGSLETLAERVAVYHGEYERLGTTPPESLPLSREVFVGPPGSDVAATARPYLAAQYRDYKSWDHGLDVDDLIRQNAVVGEPGFVIERLQQYRELGFTEIVARIDWPGMPDELVDRTLGMLADEVLPALA